MMWQEMSKGFLKEGKVDSQGTELVSGLKLMAWEKKVLWYKEMNQLFSIKLLTLWINKTLRIERHNGQFYQHRDC